MMWLLTSWGGVKRLLGIAARYPLQAAIIGLLCLSLWLHWGKQGALATIAKRDATITQMEAASKIATAAQIALNKANTDKQTEIARLTDANETNRRNVRVIIVRATDPATNIYDKILTVSLSNVNEAPVITAPVQKAPVPGKIQPAAPALTLPIAPPRLALCAALALWDMDDGRFHKVANVVGRSMSLHPHGDASIGAALVAIGQRAFLIEPQGNYGNLLTGDEAAAPRYIEARLTNFAKDVLFNPKTTTWQLSYDGRAQEPVHRAQRRVAVAHPAPAPHRQWLRALQQLHLGGRGERHPARQSRWEAAGRPAPLALRHRQAARILEEELRRHRSLGRLHGAAGIDQPPPHPVRHPAPDRAAAR